MRDSTSWACVGGLDPDAGHLSGFWLDRALRARGIANLVVGSSSVEVPRRAKSDRLDVGELLAPLLRHGGGERGV